MKECKECGLHQCCDYAYEGCIYCLETENKALKARIAELKEHLRNIKETSNKLWQWSIRDMADKALQEDE